MAARASERDVTNRRFICRSGLAQDVLPTRPEVAKSMRVLVVDDSPPRRRLLTALLGQAGHDVVTAPNGAAALEVLAGQAVEAVVSDVKMPRMDGFQLCRALRCDGRWARLPFIFYSSIFIGNRAQELGMDLGATAY